MQKLHLQLRQYADLPFPVLIEGESGSGKEIIASSCLHYDTRRATGHSWRSIVPRSRPTWLKRPCSATPEARLPAP
jgi:DNA-binding NtrC family response regulator